MGQAISAVVSSDAAKRDAFARDLTSALTAKYPDYDAIAFAVAHTCTGAFVHQHAECYYASGASTGYDVYLVRHGDQAQCVRHGDGGWINWAVYGSHYTRNDNVVTFN